MSTETLQVMLRWRPIIEVKLGGEGVKQKDYDAFARLDGFPDFAAMEAFWAEHHRRVELFRGTCIRWQRPTAPVEMGTDLAPEAVAA